jgi:hypothetical protein
MEKYHRDQKFYEDIYDRMTVEYCLSGERWCRDEYKNCIDKAEAKKACCC